MATKPNQPLPKRERVNTAGDVKRPDGDQAVTPEEEDNDEDAPSTGAPRKLKGALNKKTALLQHEVDAVATNLDAVSRYQLAGCLKLYPTTAMTGKDFAQIMTSLVQDSTGDLRVARFNVVSRSEAIIQCRTDADTKDVQSAIQALLPSNIRTVRAEPFTVNAMKKIPELIYSQTQKSVDANLIQQVRSVLPRTHTTAEFSMEYGPGPDNKQRFVRSHIKGGTMDVFMLSSVKFSSGYTFSAQAIVDIFEARP